MEQCLMFLHVSRCITRVVSRLRPIKKKPSKVIDFQGLLNVIAVRTGLEPEDAHNLIFKLLQRPYIFSVTNM